MKNIKKYLQHFSIYVILQLMFWLWNAYSIKKDFVNLDTEAPQE